MNSLDELRKYRIKFDKKTMGLPVHWNTIKQSYTLLFNLFDLVLGRTNSLNQLVL